MWNVFPQQYSLDTSSWGEGLKSIVKFFIRPAEIQKKKPQKPDSYIGGHTALTPWLKNQ